MLNPLLSLAAWSARILPISIKRQFYRIPPLARFMREALNQAAPEGMTIVTIAAGGLQGGRLILNLKEEKDYWLGTYEFELQKAIEDFVKSGMVAYDVGANIGYISLQLARQVGLAGCVYSFEALPSNLDRLRTNIELNQLSDRIQVVPTAVIDSQRLVHFLVGPSGGMGKAKGSAGRKEYAYASSIEISGISLDAFVFDSGNPPPQVIKMDIEGGEVLALPGMRRLLVEARPLLLMELHGQEAALAAWQAFKQANYRVTVMEEGYPEINSLEGLDWKAYLVALPEDWH
jgi:FkbM family methyltransferase